MLMKDSFLYKIEDYEVEEVTETPEKTWLNKHPKPQTKLILTSITMRGYHSDGKFLGYMNEESVQHMLVWFDLFWFRKAFVAFQEALQAFGYQITEIKKGE
jgi:V8-like Glu-specific endopeptidase